MLAADPGPVNFPAEPDPTTAVSASSDASSTAASPIRQFRAWLAQPPGSELLRMEQSALGSMLPDLFGYHLVQVGSMHDADLLGASRIAHKAIFDLDAAGPGSAASMVCSAESLPLAADSVDVVVLPHVLEFSANPHRVLREMERVLIGDGHLVLTGFNPWSCCGLWRLFLWWRDEAPWCGHFYGLSRIRDWLALLDLELLKVTRLFYRPPLRHARALERLAILEQVGRHAWPFFGGAYVLVAKKRVIPLISSRVRWGARRSMITSGLAEPTARNVQCDR
jgi:SAM-dependent methyltransferase